MSNLVLEKEKIVLNKYGRMRLKFLKENEEIFWNRCTIYITISFIRNKTRPNVKKHQPLSPEMKRAVRKMDRYSNEIRLIVTEKIKTVEDVKSCITRTEKNIKGVIDLRQKYRNKLRNCKDDKLITEYKLKISDCTTILNRYRKI